MTDLLFGIALIIAAVILLVYGGCIVGQYLILRAEDKAYAQGKLPAHMKGSSHDRQ